MFSPHLNPLIASATSLSVSRGGYPRRKPQPPHLSFPSTTSPSHLLSGYTCLPQQVSAVLEGSELSLRLARALHLLLTSPHPPSDLPSPFPSLHHLHCHPASGLGFPLAPMVSCASPVDGVHLCVCHPTRRSLTPGYVFSFQPVTVRRS